jgi:hypothetical protein
MDHVPDLSYSEEATVEKAEKPDGRPEEKSEERKVSPAVKDLIKKLEDVVSIEDKIQLYLDFMKASLSDKTPRFKDYWDAKHACLPLFKKSNAPHIRSQLWNSYIELSTEAKHLKTFLDEQSEFAIEQIDLAIQAVESDLDKMQELLLQTPEIYVPSESLYIQAKKDWYVTVQRELHLLNTLATRVTSFRKEVIKTEMRIRFKNKLFERLSKAGDRIFPRRKELIQQISAEFLKDVMHFSEVAFTQDNLDKQAGFAPYDEIRNEIKRLQYFAKELTLDTQTFTKTRIELSRLWEVLKEKDKERKKEFAQQREINQKNVTLVLDKIKLLAERCQAETFTPEEASKQASEILNFMKTIDLAREEVRYLKDELSKARAPIFERLAKVQEAREKEIEEGQRQKREKIEQYKERIKQVIDQVPETTVEELNLSKERLQSELQLLTVTHAEKDLLEHELKTLRDLINDKKEKAMLALTPEQRQSLDHLYQLIEEWKVQKNGIREQLEIYRRALAGSGFDFEKAMRYRELIDSEKTRLDKVNAAIVELEAQVNQLEGTS